MAKVARLFAVLLLSAGLMVPALPARAEFGCTQTVIYYPPFEPPGVNNGPVSCDVCPSGVENWVNLYRGIIIIYTCAER